MALPTIHHSLASVIALASLGLLACSRRSSDASDVSADAAASSSTTDGRGLYLQRCSVCHGKEAEGGQGPTLRGVVGRRAGVGDPRFGYTRALRTSNLVFDEAALDRFLTAPAQVVPGTAMAVATPSPEERKTLITYLATLKGGPEGESASNVGAGPVPVASAGLRTGRDAFGGYRSDGPGVRRRITVADLPKPFATESMRNNANVADMPPGAEPKVPKGFHAALFVKDVNAPRLLAVAPNGDIFVAESNAGAVQVMRPRADGSGADKVETFAKGLDDPFGIAFYPAGPSPQWVYVAESNVVRRYPYANGDMVARGPSETIVARISPTNAGHTMRNVAFSNDGKRMFIAVGSGSNIAEDVPQSSPEAIRAFEATHGLGAIWGSEESRADVLVYDPDGKNGRPFAQGIRNCSGMAVNATTGDVWCSTNERDKLGDDLVPDYVTRVHEKAFYGWPWYYLGDHEDPRLAGQRKDLAGKVTVPDVLLQPHSAPLQLSFYEGTMFPAEYRGNAFTALHGSWNRGSRTGYKVVRIIVKAGVPTGEYEDFMTGFVLDDDHVWARPVGVTVAKDGALLVSDDGNGTIWRVTYR